MTNTNTNNKHTIKLMQSVMICLVLLVSSTPVFFSATVAAQSTSTGASSTSVVTPGTTNSSTPLPVTGTGIAGNTISITFPDGTIATTVVKSDGTYVIIPLTEQKAGTITVTELNSAGVIVSGPKTVSYTGGVSASSVTPKVNIKDPYVCPGRISGMVDNAKATVIIEISQNGTVVLSIPAIVNAEGYFYVDITNKLPDGKYTNKFTATYNGMISTGSYDFMHKNVCNTEATNSTIRTGGLNVVAGIVSLFFAVFGVYFILINKFSKK
jgi:hypothetical protein